MSGARSADYGRVVEIARRIAERAPAKQNTNTFAALIPWTLIHELREAFGSYHEIAIGYFPGYGEFRPECCCGWTGSYVKSRSVAETEGATHITNEVYSQKGNNHD